jgi:Rieske Fe-S protein
MNRKNFIRTCGLSCIGAVVAPSLLQGCAGTKHYNAPIEGSHLVLPLSSFDLTKGGVNQYRNYIVAENDLLQFPIYIYRKDKDTYQALWMQCTHQGAELQAFGDRLQCPAHGSEFTSIGSVANGPASDPLRTFEITITETELKIALR